MKAYFCFFCFGLSLSGALALWIATLLDFIPKQAMVYLLLWLLDVLGGFVTLGFGLYFEPFPAYIEEENDAV